LVLISFFIIFLYYSFSIAKRVEGMDELVPSKKYGMVKSSLLVIIGLIGLALGGKLIVEGAVYIASALGVTQSFIGVTVVAVGTSLPELATSAMAAYKKNAEIAVGNVVGSNIFNIFWVLGLSSLIKPIPFQARNNIDVSVVILSSVLLFVTMFTGKKHLLDKWEGITFVVLYVSYITFLIISY